MDFEMGEPFNSVAPGTSIMQSSDSYDDLFQVQVPIEDIDQSMTEFEGIYVQSHTPPIANMKRNTQSYNVIPAEARALPPKKTAIMIKKEPLDIPFTSGIPINTMDNPIELSDTEDPSPFYKYYIGTSDNAVSVSQSNDDDDVMVLQPDGSSVPIKKEDDEVEFLWEKMDDYVIDLDSENESSAAPELHLGKSFLRRLDPKGKRPPVDRSAVMRAQQAYLRTRRRNHGIPEPSAKRGVLNGVDLEGQQRSELPVDDSDSAWMKADYTPNEDNGKGFRALKKSYNAKVISDTNTIEDDIAFTRAEKAERLRLARLKAEYESALGYSDDNDSDDGLFVSPSSATNSHSKRRASDDPGVGDERTTSRGRKQRRPSSKSKRLEQEQEINMMAGLEEFIRKKHDKQRDKKGKKNEGDKKDGPKRTKRRSKKTGYLSNLNTLLTSNIYEDANANRNREALPASGQTDKRKALAALVASVPLGTTQEDANTEKNRILHATVVLGRNIRGCCKADGETNDWRLTGMKSSLRHHQVLGASFMKERETGGDEPLGGILADAMGLGKTVETIALMISNPPPHGEKHRATLVVCTPGLLVQWERELEKHTEAGHLDKVLRHYSVNRVSGKGAACVLQDQDVILTTYQEVVKSYPRFDAPEDIRDQDELKAWWEKQWNQEKDVLHQVQFYRVVLDESQAIKNYKCQTSIACRALMAKHKWCCSATPIYNTVDELYPYFKFLGVPYTGSFNDFQDNYCKEGNDDCNSRLHCLLDQIMCRRTLKDTILGAPIVKLPKHNQRTVNINFSPVEKALYRRVFKKYVGALNHASANGVLERNPGLGLTAFLRLRQMCAHIFLVQEILEELLDLESIDNMERELICGATLENKNDRKLVAALRRMIEAKPETLEEHEEPEQVQPGDLASRFGSYLRTLKSKANWTELKTRTQCHSCGDPPDSAVVTSCLHVYCEECLQGLANKASEKDQDETACLACGELFTGAEPCADLNELKWNDHWLLNESAGRKKRPMKVNMEWVYHDNKLVMSAKTTAVRAQVEEWLKQEPDKKIIIFSQFHMIMRILEKICEKKNWKYCTYNGKMSHQARDQAIKEFTKDSDMKIMVASLKCGGVGLNLTMASRVICIDLWYNSCVEQQAFCRVFRIGQDFETFITRFIVEKSADGGLMDMQLRKNALISQAMDDRSVMSKLSVEDILRLFGDIKLDKNQKPFVHLDEDEKLDSLFEKNGQD